MLNLNANLFYNCNCLNHTLDPVKITFAGWHAKLHFHSIKNKFAMISDHWKLCCGHPPSPIPYRPFSLKYSTFYREFEWTLALPGKLIFSFRKCWKQRFWVLKISWGNMPPDPLGSSRSSARKAPYGAKKMSHPVLSRICPLLYKTAETPDHVMTLAAILCRFCWRRNKRFNLKPLLMRLRGVLVSGSSDPGSSPGRAHFVVFLSKTLYSHIASLYPDIQT